LGLLQLAGRVGDEQALAVGVDRARAHGGRQDSLAGTRILRPLPSASL
jgi:hypothetical protein